MNEVLDNIKSEIAQLREAVVTRNGDTATIDRKALADTVKELVDVQVKEQLAAAEKSRPVRRGDPIGPDGFKSTSKGMVEGGKYDGQKIDDMIFVDWLLSKAASAAPDRKYRPPSKDLKDIVTKALTATGAATGDEYVPTGMAAALWNDFFQAARVVSTVGTIPMPTDPYDLPLGWGDPTWYKGTQNTATTASDPATAKSTLTSTEELCEVDWSYDLDEDGLIAVLPTLRAMIARSGAESMDKFMMNADSTDAGTGNINLDDADPAATAYYLTNGQDGIRHQYIVDYAAGSADISTTLTDALMRAGIGRLGKYSTDTGGLVMFVDPETYVNGMLALTNVVTVDKFGPQATVLTGQLGNYGGIPIVVTSAIAEAEDDGKISTTAGNNDEGQIAIIHRDMWRVGFRRQLLFELYRDIQKRSLVMVASYRIAVACRGTRSTATHTAGIHGIVRA